MQYTPASKMKTVLAAAAAVVALGSPAIANAQAAGGDAARGKTVFARCAACHSVKPGEKRLGPSVAGVVGRRAAAVPGFNYSAAMRGSGMNWSRQNLDKFLKAPTATVRGTTMMAPGVVKDADRADLIAYLATLPAK